MRISDWSSDVCSSDLVGYGFAALFLRLHDDAIFLTPISVGGNAPGAEKCLQGFADVLHRDAEIAGAVGVYRNVQLGLGFLVIAIEIDDSGIRSEEHTSELQSLMRISYAVFCLIKKILHFFFFFSFYSLS